MTIAIQASHEEHALITTNPVEQAVYSNFSDGQSSNVPLSMSRQQPRAPHDGSFNHQTTTPLYLLKAQEGDEDTVKIRTNHHRQTGQHTIA